MLSRVFLNTPTGRRRCDIDEAFVQSLGPVYKGQEEAVGLFLSSWIALLSDSPLQTPTKTSKPFRVYRQFLNRIQADGLKETIVAYSELAHRLVSQHSLMGTPSLIGEWITDFRNTPVFNEYHAYYRSGDVEILQYLYSFLNFGKKFEVKDEDLKLTAFRGWLDVEDKLSALELDPNDILALRTILGTMLPTFEVQDFRPRFGPGSVRERGVTGKVEKINKLSYDYLIDRFLLHGHVGNYGSAGTSGLSAGQVLPDPSQWVPDKTFTMRIARLTFVPKNVKAARSICMEPNTLQFFQQGVLREMVRLIRSSELRHSVKLEDQTHNQTLCEIGSYTSEIDTLDLSSASDSVSWKLVKAIFPPSWVIPMYATRSPIVELPDGHLKPVAKYAPMGSALCFPTQNVVFWGTCVYAACLRVYDEFVRSLKTDETVPAFLEWLTPTQVRRVVRLFGRKLELRDHGFQTLGVYGDDICVDRRLTDVVIAILTRLGFTVNHEKSFRGSQAFRESCGKYCLNGSDITPMYFRIKGVRRELTAEHVASHVHLTNQAWDRGYRNLYTFLRVTVLGWGCPAWLRSRDHVKNPIPFTDDPLAFGIMCKNPTNTHLRQRYNTDYQRQEGRCWTIRYTEVIDSSEFLIPMERYLYTQWWASRGKTLVEPTSVGSRLTVMRKNGIEVTVRVGSPRHETGRPGLHWRWIPV